MPKLLLTDINILGIGAMREYEFQGTSHAGKDTSAIYGAFSKLSRLLDAHRDKILVMLWDDRCKWREEILPRYKRHRWDTPEQQAFLKSYLAQAKVIRALLAHLGFPQAYCPNFEADDIAGLICRHLDPAWQITLATTDTDWYQALQKNVVWESTRNGNVVTEADLGNTDVMKDGPFLSTDHFIQAKALAGDASDGIPGVKGVGLKTAARIIKEHGTIEALWAKYDAGDPLKGVVLQRTASAECREDYYRNLRLIDWRLSPRLDRKFQLEFEHSDTIAFNTLCAEWGLKEISESWHGFSVPRQRGLAAINAIRTILEAAASSRA
jgi:DNA polymerase-1